jgi:hypothetical protein
MFISESVWSRYRLQKFTNHWILIVLHLKSMFQLKKVKIIWKNTKYMYSD